METMADVLACLEETMEEEGIPMKVHMKINVAVDEIYSNIIHYSHASIVDIDLMIDEEKVEIVFSDDGMPYNPCEAKEPDITLSAEERSVGGLGIFICKKIMDTVRYEYKDDRNVLYLMKTI